MLRLLRKIFNIAYDNDAAFVTRIPQLHNMLTTMLATVTMHFVATN